MVYLASAAGVLASLALVLISGAMNYQFGLTLGKGPVESQIMGAASVASDVLKATAPFFIAAFWKARRPIGALAACALFALTAMYSAASAIGFASLNRTVTTAAQESAIAERNRLQAELKRVTTEIDALPRHRPVAVVDADLASQRQNARWLSTNQCTNATVKPSRDFCAAYRLLEGELATAQVAGTKQQRRERLQHLLGANDVVPSGLPGANLNKNEQNQRLLGANNLVPSDPQATFLASYLGQDVGTMQLALVLLVGALVEVGSSLGLFVSVGHLKRGMADVQAIAYGEDYLMARAYPEPGQSVVWPALLADYQTWADGEGKARLKADALRANILAVAGQIGLESQGDGDSLVFKDIRLNV